MNPFAYPDYRAFLSAQLKENRRRYGYKSRLAEAAACQKSFLSKVLAGGADLTPEHAANLVQFWKLPEGEAEYFVEQVNLARAGSPALRTHVERQLEKLRQDQANLSQRFREAVNISEEHAQVYYSAWQYTAVHYLLSVPSFQTVEAISRRLSLPEDTALQVLGFLREMGVVEKKGDRWQMNGRSYHLPRASAFTQMNHGNWRARAVQNSFEKNARDIHYTSVGTISLADVEKIRQLTLAYIESGRAAMGASSEEELFCMTCDFFRV